MRTVVSSSGHHERVAFPVSIHATRKASPPTR